MADDCTSDEHEDDWEVVASEDNQMRDILSNSGASCSDLQINIPLQNKRKRTTTDVDAAFKRQMSAWIRKRDEAVHKAYLMCCLVHVRNISKLCNDPVLQSFALSVVPLNLHRVDSLFDCVSRDCLDRLLSWFVTTFHVVSRALLVEEESNAGKRVCLMKALTTGDIPTTELCVLVFVIISRSLGYDTRLVRCFQMTSAKQSKQKAMGSAVPTSKRSKKQTNINAEATVVRAKESTKDMSKQRPHDSPRAQPERRKSLRSSKAVVPSQKSVKVSAGTSSSLPVLSRQKKPTAGKSNSGQPGGHQEQLLAHEIWAEVFCESAQTWICKALHMGPFINNVTQMQAYAHAGVDCLRGRIVEPAHFNAGDVPYILAVDNDQSVRDVTARYAKDWGALCKNARVNSAWWRSTLHPYLTSNLERVISEDVRLHDILCNGRLPATVAACKSHPLFILKRDVKKFEGLYPADVKPIGYIRDEPVFLRSSLRDLHSKESWLKEARSIKDDEEPYKMVKGRHKPSVLRNAPQGKLPDRQVDLYGIWQTEPYRPPIAENGKIPRNEFGNVYLFRSSMLPIGTVHLRNPGLSSIAKNLGIDCAEAIIGWDFHGFGSHPIFDGFIVCKEDAETVLSAWEEQRAINAQRSFEKRHKQALLNWRKFARGLLLRSRLRMQFADTEGETTADTNFSNAAHEFSTWDLASRTKCS